VRYKNNSVYEPEAAVERLREFLRFSYLTGTPAARRIGVRDTTICSWLQGKVHRGLLLRHGLMPFSTLCRRNERHHADRVSIPGIQELARDSQAEALSVLQKGEREDSEGKGRVSGSLSELRGGGAETGQLRSGGVGLEWKGFEVKRIGTRIGQSVVQKC